MTMKLINKEQATDVTARDVVPTQVDTDPARYSRMGWLVVLLGVGGFLLWAAFAPLDKGVPLGGTVAVSGNRKSIQHASGGIIDQILVKDGDRVKAGQVLVRMNDTTARTTYAMARSQYIAAKAAEARMSAELSGKAPVYPPELTKDVSDPQAAT